jgi:hypothetical protein
MEGLDFQYLTTDKPIFIAKAWELIKHYAEREELLRGKDLAEWQELQENAITYEKE